MTSLQVHQTIHTQNKTLVQCKICFKRFFNNRTLERHQKIHKNVKYKCMLCDKVVSNRKDNIRRHIRHIHHGEVDKSEITNKIEIVENRQNAQAEDDDEEKIMQLGEHDSHEGDPVEVIIPPEPQEQFKETEQAELLPVINNRVNVIQSIGNPKKIQQLIDETETTAEAQPPSPPTLPASQLPQIQEIKLPPKKKANLYQSSRSSAAKSKYDPIEQYRKILGISKDVDHPTSADDGAEEEDHDQETQVFPVHWRKRTSQNFLFRR